MTVAEHSIVYCNAPISMTVAQHGIVYCNAPISMTVAEQLWYCTLYCDLVFVCMSTCNYNNEPDVSEEDNTQLFTS